MKIHFALFILLLLVSSCKKNNTSIPLVDSVEVEEQYEEDCDKCNGKGFVFVDCDYCGGSGELLFTTSGTKPKKCYKCQGTGLVKCEKCDGTSRCSKCNGTGTSTCSSCHGSGSYYLNGIGWINCPNCKGTGYETCTLCNGEGRSYCCENGFATCSVCYGEGYYGSEEYSDNSTNNCSDCNGFGKVRIDCDECNGTGKVTKTRVVRK